MNYNEIVKFIQDHFTDGLVLVIGSGLSAAEGMPGMPELAEHLSKRSPELSGDSAVEWKKIAKELKKRGLEGALLKHAPSEKLQEWIVGRTCELLVPRERSIMSAVIKGERKLRLASFLSKTLKPREGLPILTPNYDRLIELACECASYHVDTTAIGLYAGVFDHARSMMAACKGVVVDRKIPTLEYFPRAIVLKPHGSLDWYRNGTQAFRCSADLDVERAIITPGLNKYKAGYSSPFDKHRDLANDHINRSAHLLIVGYGFNDDHLQTHLVKRISDGTPALILARTAGIKLEKIAAESPRCVCLSSASTGKGTAIVTKGARFENQGPELWDLGVLTEELLT